MTDIIKHQEFEDTYDDETHAIPSLKVIDINTVKKTGGSDLTIIIASPLKSDKYSLTRLLDKIEGYLGFILSEDFQKESGLPTPENTNIIINIHSESSAEAFELIEQSKPWVLENKATLKMKILNNDSLN